MRHAAFAVAALARRRRLAGVRVEVALDHVPVVPQPSNLLIRDGRRPRLSLPRTAGGRLRLPSSRRPRRAQPEVRQRARKLVQERVEDLGEDGPAEAGQQAGERRPVGWVGG